jgi:hypothetical protein
LVRGERGDYVEVTVFYERVVGGGSGHVKLSVSEELL